MSLLALSLRSVVRGKRMIAVVVLPLLVALVALLLRANAAEIHFAEGYATLTGGLLIPLVLALVALVLGVNAFGDERDERTLGMLLATTLPRSRIVATKYAAAAAVTWVACLPATAACLVLGAGADLPLGTAVWSLLAATALAAAAYAGLFVLLSLVLRRAVLVGLAYLVIWEGLLAGSATAFRNLSVRAYAGRVAEAPLDEVPYLTADTSLVGAVLVLLGLTAVTVVASARRLSRTHL